MARSRHIAAAVLGLASVLSASATLAGSSLRRDAAAASTRNWVQSGTARGFVECVDTNSIVKRPDGYTQYDELTFCEAKDIALEPDPRSNLNDMIRVNRVRCDQDMSGENILIKGIPYSPPVHGKYDWGEEIATVAKSMAGQTAKFVCQK